jgi:DNA-binding transcriptional MerR regulator/methylmalonyl-CoA mutase cobalamin-binding subunit
MANAKPKALELTYPLRAAARLTGLSPELLRAWERRYGVVEPMRTPGGTRRYTAADLERLRLIKAAVDAGHRIGQVARLDLDELRNRGAGAQSPAAGGLDKILQALERMQAAEAQRLLSLQLSALGPVRFARALVLPLIREIGERWADGRIGVAVEHLATGVLRSMLGASLQPSAASLRGPRIVFATPPGERHELGLQMAALTALSAGANPIYLGADLPVEDLLAAVEGARAAVLAIALVALPGAQAERVVAAIRSGLPGAIRLWVGGVGGEGAAFPDGVEYIETLGELEQRVALLGLEPTHTG